MKSKDMICTKIKLINVFLLRMHDNIVDISYNYNKANLDLQIVLLDGTFLEKSYRDILEKMFVNSIIKIDIVYVTKEVFNRNVGAWLPTGYKWLDNILYSKAEIL